VQRDRTLLTSSGRQIYFGHSGDARDYFQRLGFECPESQTTPDFLTSMTSPSERRIRTGFEGTTPRTSDDFARCWKESPERQKLLLDIEEHSQAHPLKGSHHEKFALEEAGKVSQTTREVSLHTLLLGSSFSLYVERGSKTQERPKCASCHDLHQLPRGSYHCFYLL
jgi:ATP-binding cassette subfamily G (WHITE) protein 2 (PDR)